MRPPALPDLALLLLLSTLWGASYSFIRVGVETIPPVTLIAARTLIAGGLLALVVQARGLSWPRAWRFWGQCAVQALLNSVVPFTLIAWAERSIEAGLATILNATSPVFAFLVTALLARHEAVSGRKLLGVAGGLAGTLLIVGVDALSGLGRDVAAQLAVVAASACYGGAAVWGRRFAGLDPLFPAAGSLLIGASVLVPVSLLIDRPWMLTPSPGSLGALVALSVASTALAFVLYFHLVQRLGAVGTTAQAYLRVPIGVAIGVLALGEHLSGTALAGLGLILAGVIAMTTPAGRRKR
ncbi:EamA family transporter [Aquabacter sp. L1I39]|uniref:DMT family transporter n=1 Tax=Aquabacter sp. L1I39 TaxID=2820278 RepID=UPI001ADBA43F|nr:EamA family transporter [Aquabacter sp. L1I39]QTL03808.1 EamA family transporter [Aquabacter sp. L1I39]